MSNVQRLTVQSQVQQATCLAPGDKRQQRTSWAAGSLPCCRLAITICCAGPQALRFQFVVPATSCCLLAVTARCWMLSAAARMRCTSFSRTPACYLIHVSIIHFRNTEFSYSCRKILLDDVNSILRLHVNRSMSNMLTQCQHCLHTMQQCTHMNTEAYP